MWTAIGKKLVLPALLIIFSTGFAAGQSLSLSAQLDRNEAWAGETVNLSVLLEGSEEAIRPVLDIPDISVKPLGGTVRSSRSVVTVNGRTTRQERLVYAYGFSLVPEKAGEYTIPPVEVVVNGMKLKTRPLHLSVKKAVENENYRLSFEFSTSDALVQQPVELTVRFLFAQNIRDFQLRLPGLEKMPYSVIAPSGTGETYQIDVNGTAVAFARNDSKYNGKAFSGIVARFLLHPSVPGTLSFENGSASFEALTGYQQVKDFFGMIQNQEVYSHLLIPGSSASLHIKDFPLKNRPADFTGLSGKPKIEVSAVPRKVHLGDPITLTLTFTGLNDPSAAIPELSTLLGEGLDIPDTRSPDTVDGDMKKVVQTIRVSRKDLTEIPSFSFAYFDPGAGTYGTLTTKALPLEVLETAVVTADDLEGTDGAAVNDTKVPIEKRREGIYYNYSGPGLLKAAVPTVKAWTGHPAVWTLAVLPPAVFIVLLISLLVLPQLRRRIIAAGSKKRKLAVLKRYVLHSREGNPAVFLKEFNLRLRTLFEEHGILEDELSDDLLKNLTVIREVLYGADRIDRNAAESAALGIVSELVSESPSEENAVKEKTR